MHILNVIYLQILIVCKVHCTSIALHHRHLSLPNDPVEAEVEAHLQPDGAFQCRTARIPAVGNDDPKSETFLLGEATGCT